MIQPTMRLVLLRGSVAAVMIARSREGARAPTRQPNRMPFRRGRLWSVALGPECGVCHGGSRSWHSVSGRMWARIC